MADKELKPCPFCEHSKPVVYLDEEPIPNGSPKFGFTFHYKAFVMCDNCGSKGTVYLNQTKSNAISDAITAWNHRQPDTKLESRLAALQWRSVEDGLPEDTRHVRILNRKGQATDGWYTQGEWRFVMCWDDQGFFFSGDASNITHWMPIPALPEQENTNDR